MDRVGQPGRHSRRAAQSWNKSEYLRVFRAHVHQCTKAGARRRVEGGGKRGPNRKPSIRAPVGGPPGYKESGTVMVTRDSGNIREWTSVSPPVAVVLGVVRTSLGGHSRSPEPAPPAKPRGAEQGRLGTSVREARTFHTSIPLQYATFCKFRRALVPDNAPIPVRTRHVSMTCAISEVFSWRPLRRAR